MSNILIVPNSGSIYFSTGLVGSSTIPNLSSGVAFQFDNSAGVNITSYATGVNDNDRFSVDGYNGRLFNVSDNLTGVIFSVNDAAGLPIIEVDSSAVDKITMGTYASNTFVINDNRVGIGTGVPAAKLDIFDNVLAGSAGLSGSILNLNQTWNTSGTPSAIKLNVTDTASNAASKLLDLQLGAVSKFSVDKAGGIKISDATSVGGSDQKYLTFNTVWGEVIFTNWGGQLWILGLGLTTFSVNSPAYFTTHIGLGGNKDTADVKLWKDASNILAQRNGVNAQAFRLYNTYTDATTFERLNIKWDTNVLKIGTEKGAGGGTARSLEIQTDGVARMTFPSNGNAIVHGFINPSYLRLAYGGGGTAHMYCSGNGRVTLYNTAETGFDRIELGGITSSFPAIKRNGAGIQIRLADDSANAALETSSLTATGGDIEITSATSGVIFKTPDGTKRYRMTIDNAGAPVFTLLA